MEERNKGICNNINIEKKLDERSSVLMSIKKSMHGAG